jgi:hypothetical protein
MNYYEISPLFRMPRLSAVADILESTPYSILYWIRSDRPDSQPRDNVTAGQILLRGKQFGDFIILRSRVLIL